MSPLSIKAQADTSISDSCNCNACCPRSCCMPWRGRNVNHHDSPRETDIEIYQGDTVIKIQQKSQLALNQDDASHVNIDVKKIDGTGDQLKE